MGLTVTVLLLAAAALTCLGVAIGVALSRRERRSATSAADLAGLAGTDTAVPVLAALRSTVVVLDDDDEVLRASASAYTFNIVRDDAVIEPTVVAMVGRVRASGQAQDAAVTVARGRVAGAGQFHLQVRVAGIGQGRVLILIEDHPAARRVEAMRRDFVANVSHELKTPVGAIQLLAETVEAGADDPDFVRDYSGRMRKEARRLGVLVQEIIELTRLQEGDALAEPEVVDVDDVVAEAVDRVRVEANGRQITLVAGGTKGLRVRGDAALIPTAVRNLLDNAIRYSEPRTRVSVGVSLDAEDPDIVRIAVVDQGIGIPKEEQERVFERVGDRLKLVPNRGVGSLQQGKPLTCLLEGLLEGALGVRAIGECTGTNDVGDDSITKSHKTTLFLVFNPPQAPSRKRGCGQRDFT